MAKASSKGSTRAKGREQVVAAADAKVQERPTRQGTPHVRRAVLKAAADLFAERGFGGTNLADVAAALGMSRPGLYYHFASKEKLLEALIEEVTVSVDVQLNELVAETERDPEDALSQVLRISTLWVLENHVLFRVLDRAEVDLPPDLKHKHDASKKSILEHFTRIIERGIAAGKFRPVDPHVAALAVIGMRNWTAWWYHSDGRIPKQEIADAIAQMAVCSLVQPDAKMSRKDRVKDALRVLDQDIADLLRTADD